MNKRLDIMVDIETLGKGIHSTIIQLAAVPFDITTGTIYTDKAFNRTVDISLVNIQAEGDTLKWWMKENPELFASILERGTDSEIQMLKLFRAWLWDEFLDDDKEDPYLWGNGILFDNAMIKQKMVSSGLPYPIVYNRDRDVRTIVELAALKEGISEKTLKENFTHKNTVAHDALQDAIFQTELVCECYKIIMS